MATYTSHYDLIKPSNEDPALIGDINGNMDILDETVYNISQDVATLEETAAVKDDIYYKAGNTFECPAQICPAFITNNKKDLYFMVSLDKNIDPDAVINLILLSGTISIRQNGNYLYGTNSSGILISALPNPVQNNVASINNVIIHITMTPDSNAIDNESCSVYLTNFTVSFISL